MNEFIDSINGKSVVLIGNSSSILQEQKGHLIDSYDFVVRFNLAACNFYRYPEKSVGRKFDVWVYAMMSEKRCIKVYNEMKIKPKFFIRNGNTDNFQSGELTEKSICINYDFRRKFKESLMIKEHPSTGIVFLHYLNTCCNPSKISIIGFDSFENKNFYVNKQMKVEKWHNIVLRKARSRLWPQVVPRQLLLGAGYVCRGAGLENGL